MIDALFMTSQRIGKRTGHGEEAYYTIVQYIYFYYEINVYFPAG